MKIETYNGKNFRSKDVVYLGSYKVPDKKIYEIFVALEDGTVIVVDRVFGNIQVAKWRIDKLVDKLL